MRKTQSILFLLLTFSHFMAFGQVTSFTLDPEKINKQLASKLDSLFQEDQDSRLKLSTLQKEKATEKQIESLRVSMRSKDSTNLIFVRELIDRYGWLGPEEVGFRGAQALFLVIQHAHLNIQKKYYPLILDAEKNGKILSSNVAILEDRIAVRERRHQTYGSQGYYDRDRKKLIIYPLKDVIHLDSLRHSRGLPNMKDYIKNWDLQDYNADLPYAQELLKKHIGL